jgi:hypothetical protein
MQQHDLLATLSTLHEQLSGAGEIDSETQKMLKTVTADIQSVLAGQTTDANSEGSLSERLRETLIEFQVRHPHVGGLLDRITDGLSSIGI